MRVESERLILRPVSDGEMEELIRKEQDPELKAAYEEMLRGCLQRPESRLWHTVWLMEPKSSPGTAVGDLSFKGPPADGLVELGYGLREGCCGKGYMTEAVKALCRWALAREGVTGIEAETAPDNAASRRVLMRAGFQPTGVLGEEGPRFRLIPAVD